MLILIGYWSNGHRWIHPRMLVDPEWQAGCRHRIVEYLKSGARIHQEMGFSHCRFTGGPPDAEMGNAERTDGMWIWPEGLWIYVVQYNVRLPEDFVQHMKYHNYCIPGDLKEEALIREKVDTEYWRKWCKMEKRKHLRNKVLKALTLGFVKQIVFMNLTRQP